MATPTPQIPFQTVTRLLALAAMLGCGHTEPFSTPPFARDQPFDPTPPVRLTLNRGPDRRPAWLPDGSGILYSSQLVNTRERDVCLAQVPTTGGSQRRFTCELTPNSINLTDALESAAPAADGRLAFFAATSNIGDASPNLQGIALGSVLDPATDRLLQSVPYTLPGGRLHTGVSQIRWLGANRIVFLGEAVTVYRPCQFCSLDTLRSGLDAVWLDVTETPATLHSIPGTDLASGVSPGASEDEVYYTLNGDSRVYREQLSSGDVTVVHDFGAAGFARDVHVMGNRMAAVVGGRVAFAPADPSLGPTQWDSGGVIHVVNLLDGDDTMIDAPGPGLSRRPQLSPSGSAVVAEVYPLLIGLGPTTDTTVSKVGDLFTFGQP